MKNKPKEIWLKNDLDWTSQEFRFLKERDIFSFDRHEVFTASCDAFIVENEGFWSVLVVNKETERFIEEKRRAREKLFSIL